MRRIFDDRRTNFRNRERLNRLLMLVQLELLGLRNEARYARAIRAHLEANGGFADDRRLILDAKGQPCSLRLP